MRKAGPSSPPANPIPTAHRTDQLGSPVREAGTDLARRKLNSLGNYPIYEALKWSFQSTRAWCLCGTASTGASAPTGRGSDLVPLQQGSAPAELCPGASC